MSELWKTAEPASRPHKTLTGQPINGCILRVEGLGKVYSDRRTTHTVFTEIDLEVEAEEFLCIVGPSGCGKTTLLRCIGGLITPTAGRITLRDELKDSPGPAMAMVFQDYGRSLLPWLTVNSNIALPLRAQGLKTRDIAPRVAGVLEEVGLGDAGKRHPWQLSGGMQQRVAIARALVVRPRILLMDEPFASVDAQTREELEDLILAVQTTNRMTVIFITHDIDEAIYLGNRVAVLSKGPTKVKSIHEVNLPEPRDQITTRQQQRYTELRVRVRQELRNPPSS